MSATFSPPSSDLLQARAATVTRLLFATVVGVIIGVVGVAAVVGSVGVVGVVGVGPTFDCDESKVAFTPRGQSPLPCHL